MPSHIEKNPYSTKIFYKIDFEILAITNIYHISAEFGKLNVKTSPQINQVP